MDDLIKILILLYKHVSPCEIINGEITYDDFTEYIFCRIANANLENYTGDDIQNLYRYMTSESLRWNKNSMSKINSRKSEQSFCILEPLQIFAQQVLREEQGNPVCQYDNFLNWRVITLQLDEDLFTTSFLACSDQQEGVKSRSSFSWKNILGHDNVTLNNMLKKGLVENHFHLKGSAPYFRMSWINLMNLVNNNTFAKILRQYDKNPLFLGKSGNNEQGGYSYEMMHLQTALIRLFFYSILGNEYFDVFKTFFLNINKYRKYINMELVSTNKDIEVSRVKEVFNYYRTKHKLKKINTKELCIKLCENRYNHSQVFLNMLSIISDKFYFTEKIFYLDSKSEFISEMDLLNSLLDCITTVKLNLNNFSKVIIKEKQKILLEELNYRRIMELLNDFEGLKSIKFAMQSEIERYIIRKTEREGTIDYMEGLDIDSDHSSVEGWGERLFMYTMFYKLHKGEMKRYGNLFFTYLVMKERLRSEMVQSNDKIGFHNFLEYQNRKEYFIEDTPFEKIYTETAIKEAFHSQALLALEARISPKNTVRANVDNIIKLDKAIKDDEIRRKVFYVFHFVKSPDALENVEHNVCRHYNKRKEVKKQALTIAQIRSLPAYREQARRIYGIDACNKEIGCRPEVFGQAFRFLRKQQIGINSDLPKLGATFHVGEDFVDIADGLRAIDEAIYFLNLTYGDRLGHALALGVSPREWYASKRFGVFITRQDHLDNMVWIYQKIRKYNITHTENILLTLQRSFTHCFNEIYSPINNRGEYTIDVYYDAWKLRGDDPELYSFNKYKGRGDLVDWWKRHSTNDESFELDKIREDSRCVYLYYMYHYDNKVKKKGREVIGYKITAETIDLIEKIQWYMQREVMQKGLCIETNPSSNYQIGTFKRYDNHPILNFYNYDLVTEFDKLEKCPQIPVTINTDDQAIFSTSLENEYAYMAIALEKALDSNGKPLYKRTKIYSWLNNIRKNGREWCFNQDTDFTQRGVEEADDEE